jgi:hypothetical protein
VSEVEPRRRFDVGPGFVRARECPDCGHTRCGDDCTCNCDAAHAEHEAATLRRQLAEAEGVTARAIELQKLRPTAPLRHDQLWYAIEAELRDLRPSSQAIEDWRRVTVAYTSDHPASIGCLLAIVRELWDDAGAYVRQSSRGGWVVCIRGAGLVVIAGPFRGATEGEALLAALQAAPQKGMRKHPIGAQTAAAPGRRLDGQPLGVSPAEYAMINGRTRTDEDA